MKKHDVMKIFSVLSFTVLVSGTAFADAFIGYLYPSGAKQGETVDIIVGGMQLWGANTVLLTGGGYTVEKISSIPGFNHPYHVQRRYIIAAMKARKAGKELPVKPEITPDWRPHKYYDRIGELTETELIDTVIQNRILLSILIVLLVFILEFIMIEFKTRILALLNLRRKKIS